MIILKKFISSSGSLDALTSVGKCELKTIEILIDLFIKNLLLKVCPMKACTTKNCPQSGKLCRQFDRIILDFDKIINQNLL